MLPMSVVTSMLDRPSAWVWAFSSASSANEREPLEHVLHVVRVRHAVLGEQVVRRDERGKPERIGRGKTPDEILGSAGNPRAVASSAGVPAGAGAPSGTPFSGVAAMASAASGLASASSDVGVPGGNEGASHAALTGLASCA